MSIVKNIKAFSNRYPERYAVIDKECFLTYQELDIYSSKYAEYLLGVGVKSSDKVMICLNNSSWFIVALLALEKLEATIIPINYHMPPKEVSSLYQECGVSFLITEEVFRDRFSHLSMNIIYKEEINIGEISCYGNKKQVDSIETNGQIIFFTSGSTGKPKGILVNKKNVIPSIPPDLSKKEGARHLIVRPIFFRPYLTLAYTTLLQGDTLILSKTDSPEAICRLIEEYSVTQMTSGPTDLYKLVDLVETSLYNIPSCLTEILSTGRSLPNELRTKLSTLVPHATIVDFYGSSEVGAICSIDNSEWDLKPGSSGIPEYFINLKITDENGDILENGQIGEVCVESRQLMDEYYNDNILTKRVFSQGFLKTGDQGYLDEDGYLYLVGRKHEVINKGGYNFYCSELENALLQIDWVEQATVVPVENNKWGQVPAAFIKLRKEFKIEDKEVMFSEIKQQLLSRIDEFKIPKYITFVNDIPINLGGKVDKRALLSLMN